MSSFNFKKNSLANRWFISTSLAIVAFAVFGCLLVIFRDYERQKKFSDEIIHEQIGTVLRSFEDQRLLNDYEELTRALWKLNLVDSVVLFNDRCEVLARLPLNAIYHPCTEKSGWLVYRIDDPISDLKSISAKPIYTIQNKLLTDVALVLGFGIILTALTIFFGIWRRRNELERPIENLIKNLDSKNKDVPEELKPLIDNLEKNLEKLNLAEKEASLGQTAAQIAHDIRSPLTALKMVASTLEKDDQRGNLIRQAVERVNQMAEVILQNVRALKAKPTPQVANTDDSKVNLIDVINSIVEEKKLEFNHKSFIEFAVRNSLPQPPMVKISRFEFSRVLSNLINNSADAIQEGPGLISIVVEESNGEATVHVIDNGKGMSEDILARLGEKHFSTYHSTKNFGIGVHSAINTVKSWGGNIKFLSGPGRGTQVSLSVPLEV